jgi:hypothetical protein
MARDPRKGGAFESGMRGKEKPKVESGNTGGDRGARGPDGGAGSEDRQAAGKTVGDSNGVDLSAYTSGMRGMEKPKQKGAANQASEQVKGRSGGESRQGPDAIVGQPEGHTEAGKGNRTGVSDGTARSAAQDAYAMGRNDDAANSSELAAEGKEPQGDGILGEEDDTHINIRIPKASLKRKASGVQTN